MYTHITNFLTFASGCPKILDDCYTILRSNQISPEELLLTLNSINPSIQFTMKYSKDQIPFLDILIKKNENGIWMDLYHKPKDTRRCLPSTSSHPNHCKQNMPFCLGQTFCLYIYIYIMFEIRAFYLASYFSGIAEEPLHQDKRYKNQLRVWGSL